MTADINEVLAHLRSVDWKTKASNIAFEGIDGDLPSMVWQDSIPEAGKNQWFLTSDVRWEAGPGSSRCWVGAYATVTTADVTQLVEDAIVRRLSILRHSGNGRKKSSVVGCLTLADEVMVQSKPEGFFEFGLWVSLVCEM